MHDEERHRLPGDRDPADQHQTPQADPVEGDALFGPRARVGDAHSTLSSARALSPADALAIRGSTG
jgi:hypothetical protein